MVEKRALGKGLSSLLPIGNKSDNSNKVYFECPIEDVVPNEGQPRKLFDKAAIDELAQSIQEKGIIQPLIVRKLGGGKFELIAGERRLRASLQLGLEKVPVIIKDVDDQESLELALIENIQRRDLNPVEEALAYKELMGRYQYTQDELAKRLGRDRSTIANMLRLLKLPESIRASIISGQLSMGHARALLAIEDREMQAHIADEVIKNGLSVRDIENLVSQHKAIEEKNEAAEVTGVAKVNVAEKVVQINQRYKLVQEELRKNLKTQVEVKSSGKKGKIVVHFYNDDDFNRLYDVLMQS